MRGLLLGGVSLLLLPLTLYVALDDGTPIASVDPVITTVNKPDGTVHVTAEFVPRVGWPSEVDYKHRFVLTNPSSDELVVTGTSRSCGCIDGSIDKLRIPSEGSATVLLQIKPGDQIFKDASMTVEIKGQPRHTYSLKTITYRPIMLDFGDGEPLSLGVQQPLTKTEVSRKVFLYSSSKQGLGKLECVPTPHTSPIKCSLEEIGIEELHQDRVFRRIYNLSLDVSVGEISGNEVLHLRDANARPGQPEFKLTVNWHVRDPVELSPERWIVTRSEDSANENKLEQRVVVRGIDKVPFRISSATAKPDTVSVELDGHTPKTEHVATVKLDASKFTSASPLLEQVHFHISVEGGNRREFSKPFYIVIRQ